ncbi:hypothetical protein FRC19_010000 [Serendipita sp. 401]|nr:hypothetical protein FRC15_006809 [Serendipita sp. 397]KAG8802939.1 hypothetical protein FRC16_008269 [Serendipita sp. 398]KAG8825996.1 hypothetical protein FRC19_010000 [Serendipita sp. 401]KAG8872561.1 hypothetical protein FRC20_009412 [Serendipita sp. 405]KAG9056648.1 hypothetical protein FS842_010019 [Serendipita sp. 407]
MSLSNPTGNSQNNYQTSRFASQGIPSQYSQTSRKGKRAWRKNVDITQLEEGLEELREEERIIGAPLHKKTDNELFTVDLTGDDKIRQLVKTKKPLTASIILGQRSAVPAVSSKRRQDLKKFTVTREEKERLRRIAKHTRSGPLNSVVDTSEVGNGSALMETTAAVKSSGKYDIWSLNTTSAIPSHIQNRIMPMYAQISVPAVSRPHQGTSYNPPLNDYRNLLSTAHQVEEKRVAKEETLDAIKKRMESARREVTEGDAGVAEGMVLDEPDDDSDGSISLQEESVMPSQTLPKRKTQQQRQKALRVLQEHRNLKEKAARKRMLVTVERAKALGKQIDKAQTAKEREAALSKLEKLKAKSRGTAGMRIGRHRVPEPEVEVQLGDDLTETLTGIKVEGNLFKDRFLSMQNRALIEPRTPVFPTHRKHKVKEVEKFAWKRFA